METVALKERNLATSGCLCNGCHHLVRVPEWVLTRAGPGINPHVEQMMATEGRARRSELSWSGKEGSASERIAIVTSNKKSNLASGAVPGGQGSVLCLSVQKNVVL